MKKAELPIIGRVFKQSEPIPHVDAVSQSDKGKKNKLFVSSMEALGGFLQYGNKTLSTDKTLSNKLLKANREWVYRNSDVIAKEVSKMEFELFQLGLKDGEIVYNEVDQHPLLDLLDRFNSTTSKSDALYTTQSHKKLTGNAYWLLDKNGSTIQNIFFLPPDKVELDLGDPTANDGNLVKGYKYKDVINGKEIEEYYTREEIVHFKTPNPDNPFMGLGVVEAIAETIDTDNLANNIQKSFLEKGAITDFVLSTDKAITDDQLKRLKAEMKAGSQGAKNAWELMVLSGGLKPVNVGATNKDMQFANLVEWYRDKIMIAFGNTKAAIGVIDDVNRAAHESSMIEWKRNTVKPDMDAILNTLNEFLVPMFGDKLVLGYTDPVPEDRTDDLTEATDLKNAGIITINEARALLDYEEIEGGDVLAATPTIGAPAAPPDDNPDNPADPAQEEPDQSKSMKRTHRYRANKRLTKKLGKVPPALAHIDAAVLLRKHRMFTVRRLNHEAKEAAKPIIRQMLNDKKKKVKKEVEQPKHTWHSQFDDDTIMGYYNKQIALVEVWETRFEEAVKTFIGKIKEATMQNLDTAIAGESKEAGQRKALKKIVQKQQLDLFDDEDLQVTAQLDLTPILMQEVVLAGEAAYKLLGVEDTYMPYKLQESIAANVAKFTQSMLDTDRNQLISLIENGIQEGQSVPQIRDAITSEFDTISKVQSARVTRTEVLRASNMAAEDAYQQSGVVEAKQWLTAGAEDECADFEGQIITLGGDFYSSDNEFQDGDPPLHPNCRCIIVPIVVGKDEA